jgi:hypothetical protein
MTARMTTQHTPGPWSVERPSYHYGMRQISGPSLTCRGFTKALDVDEALVRRIEADARLIAAAPDMLAALEAALASLEHADLADGVCCCGDSMDVHSSPMDCGHSPVDAGEYYGRQAIAAVRAAIAKAKGEPQ